MNNTWRPHCEWPVPEGSDMLCCDETTISYRESVTQCNYGERKRQCLQALHSVWLCPSAVASAHLDGRERSVLRPCLCVMWSTVPPLCAPTAPPASLSQVDIPASAPSGLQGSTASKVASLKTNCIITFVTYLSHKTRPPLFSYLQLCFFFALFSCDH